MSFQQTERAGYLHENYAAALSHVGQPRHLERCGAWIIERPIQGTRLSDATGCYPLFCCDNWDAVGEELSEFAGTCVSLTLVTDPFGEWTPTMLATDFPDFCRPFKTHHIIELAASPLAGLGQNHKRNIRHALGNLRFEVLSDPMEYFSDWIGLYAQLVERHGIRGVADFSISSFERQFRTPGLTAIAAVRDERTVGMTLWYRNGEHAYYHLAGYSEEGYSYSAAFGMFHTAVEYLAAEGIRKINLGAGLDEKGEDGLSRFKRGWANAGRQVFLCGRIFDRSAYAQLSGAPSTGYFPAYRA